MHLPLWLNTGGADLCHRCRPLLTSEFHEIVTSRESYSLDIDGLDPGSPFYLLADGDS